MTLPQLRQRLSTSKPKRLKWHLVPLQQWLRSEECLKVATQIFGTMSDGDASTKLASKLIFKKCWLRELGHRQATKDMLKWLRCAWCWCINYHIFYWFVYCMWSEVGVSIILPHETGLYIFICVCRYSQSAYFISWSPCHVWFIHTSWFSVTPHPTPHPHHHHAHGTLPLSCVWLTITHYEKFVFVSDAHKTREVNITLNPSSDGVADRLQLIITAVALSPPWLSLYHIV